MSRAPAARKSGTSNPLLRLISEGMPSSRRIPAISWLRPDGWLQATLTGSGVLPERVESDRLNIDILDLPLADVEARTYGSSGFSSETMK